MKKLGSLSDLKSLINPDEIIEHYFKILEESPNLVSRATLIMFIIYMIGVMIILLNLKRKKFLVFY